MKSASGISPRRPPRMSVNPDLDAALGLLDQASDLAARVDPGSWTSPRPEFRDSTLGQHLRHTLEHLEALVAGVESGTVDYDARARDASLETSPAAARRRCHQLATSLAELGESFPPSQPLCVTASSASSGESPARESSFGRELQFVVSHTIHHFAIVAAICHRLDIAVDAELGIAPSTLKHRRSMARG